MFDYLPWMDEVHIVEMGRMFLCGGDVDSLLINRSGVTMLTISYVCPLIQECAYRLFGQIGVRVSPFVGLALMWFSFRKWLLAAFDWRRPTVELVALLLLTNPLVFQSAALARPDAWALAFTFSSLAVLGRPDERRSVLRLSSGAFLAVLSVFAWPSSILSAAVYPVFCFDFKRGREFAVFCLAALFSAGVLAVPLLPKIDLFLAAFMLHTRYSAPAALSLAGVCEPIAREIARSPLLAVIGGVGLYAWTCERRFMAALALLWGFVVGARSNLYAFRLVYLTPVFMLLCADGVDYAVKKRYSLAKWALIVSVAFGVVAGPVGAILLSHSTLPVGLKDGLAKTVGTGSRIVLAPDFATYYIGRELGWRQLGFGYPRDVSDKRLVRQMADRAEAVVQCDWDPYETTQRSFTPYGLFCRYVLEKSREEADKPYGEKSWPARFGSHFSGGWHLPVELDGFPVTNRIGMIRVLKRN